MINDIIVYGWLTENSPTDIYIWGWFHPSFNQAGVETVVYNALEAQILEDSALMTYVRTWKGDTKPRTYRSGDFPLIQFFPHRVIDETFIAVPSNKLTTVEQEIHGKVWVDNPVTLETEKLRIMELICDAIEKDLHLGSPAAATKAQIFETRFNQLSDRIAEAIVTVRVTTRNFYAPLRQAAGFSRTA